MFNTNVLMKLMNARNTFSANHPKFVAFLETVTRQGVQEGCVLEVTVTRPDGKVITGNMRVTQSDLELLQELQSLGNMQ